MLKILPIAVAAVAAVSIARAQAPEAKTAEQVYKNITALKGTPADELQPSMQFIAASLGVNCEFCHVPGKPEADEKGAKRTAREMIAMQNEINKASFRGRTEITCYTCHRGSGHPTNVPPVLESDAAPHPAAAPAPSTAGAPTVDEIIEKYVTAVGGAGAIQKATTRVMTGTILFGGGETSIEVIAKAPDKRVSITQMGGGSSYTAFDGTAGWLGSSGRPAREMSAAESAAAALDARFELVPHLKEIFPQLRRVRPEVINGALCDVLMGGGPGKPPVRLYFDRNSGLLVRMVRYAETPLGRNPTEIDYADYRDAGGVKIPYRWTLARPNGRFTIRISEVKTNVPVEDSRFAKPAGEVK